MLVSADPEGYARCCEALEHWDVSDELARIAAPTLVLAGAEDRAAPPDEHSERLADAIPGARLKLVERAAHLVNVERADEVNRLLLEHL
jgi:pimeloyl-ACP methyl ester carboxylesterase